MEDQGIPTLHTAHVVHVRHLKKENIYIFRKHTIFKDVQNYFSVVGAQFTLYLFIDRKNTM